MKLPARRCEAMGILMGRKLVAEGLIAGVTPEVLAHRLRDTLVEDLAVEDKLNDEVRELLQKHADALRDSGADYHEAFKRAKAKLVRERKLVL